MNFPSVTACILIMYTLKLYMKRSNWSQFHCSKWIKCLASLSQVRSYQPQHYKKKFFSLHKHELLQYTDSHSVLISSSFVVFVAEERIPFCMKVRNSIQFLFFIHLPGFLLVISWSFNLEQFCITAIRNMWYNLFQCNKLHKFGSNSLLLLFTYCECQITRFFDKLV